MTNYAELEQQNKKAHQFCVDVQREYAVRTAQFQPASVRERRWRAEGICALTDFDTFKEITEHV